MHVSVVFADEMTIQTELPKQLQNNLKMQDHVSGWRYLVFYEYQNL